MAVALKACAGAGSSRSLRCYADAVHALLIHPWTARRSHSTDPADARQGTTCATAASAFLAGGATCIAWEAGPLARAAGVAGAADLASRAADALPGAQLLGLTALAVTRRADGPAPAGAVDLAATSILDDLVTFPLAELATGFRAALAVLVLPIPVMLWVMAPVPAATADDGPIATATGAARSFLGHVGDEKAE
jgi:hypothetical protein